MKKMNFEANQKEVLQFVEELQRDPLLEGYEINQSNANDFYILKEDKKIVLPVTACLNVKI